MQNKKLFPDTGIFDLMGIENIMRRLANHRRFVRKPVTAVGVTRKNKEESKKRRKMAKATRKINRGK